MVNYQRLIVVLLVSFLPFFISCNDDDDNYVPIVPTVALESPVILDLTQVPYAKLSDYKFFEGVIKNLTPSYGVIPYKPTSELFTDYAIKKRFIWLPKGAKATYNGDGNVLNLPVGAALIKNFYYNNVQPNNSTKIIETRVMIRKSDGWIFAEYVWDSQQSDAFLQTDGSTTPVSWKDENNIIQTIDYKIPSTTLDCKRCHGVNNLTEVLPIGIKPQNLNSNYSYSEGTKNQLNKLIEFGYLDNNLPASIVSVVDYKDTTQSLNLRVRSYFDSNCSHCHVTGGEADHFNLRFSFNQTTTPLYMGVCLTAEHSVVGYRDRIVYIGDYTQSILHYRVNTTTDTNFMMPPLGRTIKHKEGVRLIEEWINSLTTCD